MILVVVSNAAFLSKEFLLFPFLLPQIKAIAYWNWESCVKILQLFSLEWSTHPEYLVLMKMLSESFCCFVPELPQTRGIKLILSVSLQGVFCAFYLSQQKCVWYRLENCSSSLPEQEKSSLDWLLSSQQSEHKHFGKILLTLR